MNYITVFFTDSYDRKSSHSLLFKCALIYTGKKEFTLCLKKYGKPYFENPSAPEFSISHSENIWICSFAPLEVGCDIQLHKSLPRYKNIATRFFHSNELNHIEKAANPEAEFFDIWSKKEAVSKMLESGINTDFKNIDTFSQAAKITVKNITLPCEQPYSAAISYKSDFEYKIITI